MIFVYTTCRDKNEADAIIASLFGKRLAACVNSFDISSQYLWKGKMKRSKEVACIIKTKDEHFKKIEKEIRNLSSYDTPCVVKIDISNANKEYIAWIESEASGL